MAIWNAHDAKGLREDLADVIYNISPTDTPFQSSVGRTKATAVYHEWQTDSLAAATTNNAAVEGADASDATLSATTRLGNYTQILQKTIKVSGTLDAVNKAGRKSERLTNSLRLRLKSSATSKPSFWLTKVSRLARRTRRLVRWVRSCRG